MRALASAERYVAGTTSADAFDAVHRLAQEGLSASVELLGENTADPAEADGVARHVELAQTLADAPESTWLSIDLSHLGLDVDPDGCLARLTAVAEALPPGRLIQVGAKEAERAGAIQACVLAAHREGLPVSATLQANLRRSTADAARLAEAGLPIRLVKGAYVEGPETAWPYGPPTDLAFLRLARELAGRTSLMLATHDPVLLEALLPASPGTPVEHLLGVRPDQARELARRGREVRVYVPFGERWFRYWARRVAESRGA